VVLAVVAVAVPIVVVQAVDRTADHRRHMGDPCGSRGEYAAGDAETDQAYGSSH